MAIEETYSPSGDGLSARQPLSACGDSRVSPVGIDRTIYVLSHWKHAIIRNSIATKTTKRGNAPPL